MSTQRMPPRQDVSATESEGNGEDYDDDGKQDSPEEQIYLEEEQPRTQEEHPSTQLERGLEDMLDHLGDSVINIFCFGYALIFS